MKPEKICDALGQLDESLVAEADAVRSQVKKKKIPWTRIVSLAASFVIIVLGVLLVRFLPSGSEAFTVAAAEYPYIAPYPEDEFGPGFEKRYDEWHESRRANRPESGYADGLEGYFEKTVSEFLSGTDGENRVFSPLSLYMALSMAAETAEGESRAQILSLIGKEDIESLRTQANNVWRGSYSNDGATTSIMANSLWFDNDLGYNIDTVNTIADTYYASVYHGEMASDELNEAMREWLSEQTGGLLEDAVRNVGIDDPDTIMAMFSTVYYRAKWETEFNPDKTEDGVFHALSGDMDAEFMYRRIEGQYYWSENFAAVQLGLENSGGIWLVLPDEGVSMDTLMADEKLYELTLNNYVPAEDWKDQVRIKINLRLPKFDISSDFSLTEGLRELGVTDIFDTEKADLSPLVENIDSYREANGNPYYSSAKQAARVAVDEEGITAAAFTEMLVAGAAEPPEEEVDFTLDRPFFFALSHSDGLPLFTGVVNEP